MMWSTPTGEIPEHAKSASVMLAAMSCLGLVILLGGGPQATPPPSGPDRAGRLTEPTLVRLDFRDRPIGEVVRELGRRSGRAISDRGGLTKDFNGLPDRSWVERPVTLEAGEPVPFWEAIDRLAVAGHVGYHLAKYGDTGAEWTGVLFEGGDANVGDFVQYAGPFRVSLEGLHEHRDLVFVRGPWIQVFPSGYSGWADAADLATAPADGGPFHAEMQVMAEPGLIVRRTGPVNVTEAVDDRGRSLIGSIPNDRPAQPWTFQEVFEGGVSPALRAPLRRPDGGPAGKVLRRFRGTIPVEIAALRAAPVLAVRLDGAEGKTFRGGGYTVVVEKARPEPDGRFTVALTVRPDEAIEPAARSAILMRNQWLLADAAGRAVRFMSGGTGGDERGGARITSEYQPQDDLPTGPPVEFRLFGLERVNWEIPFEFRDVPLP
jgi:hypothetical protein